MPYVLREISNLQIKNSTQVSEGLGSEVSRSKQQPLIDSSQILIQNPSEASQSNPDMIINDPKEANKCSQMIKINGVVNELHYQDPKLQVIDEYEVKKLMKEVNSDIDIEEAMQIEK